MAGRRYEARATRTFSAARELVWALVADSNRWERAAGLAPARYRWAEREGARVREARAREMGLRVGWVEPPYEWSAGHFVRGRRVFFEGPAGGAGFAADITAEDGAARVVARAWVEGRVLLLRVLGPWLRRRLRRALVAYLDAVAVVLEGAPAGDAASHLPAARRARALLAGAESPLSAPPQGPVDTAAIRARAAGLPDDLPPAARRRLLAHLARAPDDDVAQMRPFDLADAWGAPRREVLRLFLHATRAGLVDLAWQINCPVCRVAADTARGLDRVGPRVHCAACGVHYDIDFARHVEAVFVANAAIRKVEPAVYCASSPLFSPHIVLQARIPAGETRRLPLPHLGPGHMLLRVLGSPRMAEIQCGGARGEGVGVAIGPEAIEARCLVGGEAGGGAPELVAENGTAAGAVLLLERSAWDAGSALGTMVATFPEFVDLFATEAPAAGVELRVGQVAVLFSDLTGSTALYRRVGDARAFAIVQEHFRAMRAAVDQAGGAVVKTMGDAVMASFAATGDAVRGALAMHAAHGPLGRRHAIGLKVGLAAGPCLAVRANDRLDLFGTTVNLAARLQGQATGGELVVPAEIAAHADVAPQLRDLERQGYAARLKGMEAAQELVRVRVGTRAPAT